MTEDLFHDLIALAGTLTGVSEFLKQKNPALLSVAVEPSDSPVISGGAPGPHKIQGIGAGFIPANLNTHIIDRIVQVESPHAFAGSKQLAKEDGILCGISSGAAFHAAREVAKDHPGKNIVFIICDTGERYISTDLFAI